MELRVSTKEDLSFADIFKIIYKGKLLIIDVDENSYNENQEDLGKIVSSIDAKLHGLF